MGKVSILEVNWKKKNKMEVKMTYSMKSLFERAFAVMRHFYENLAFVLNTRWNLVRFLVVVRANLLHIQPTRF